MRRLLLLTAMVTALAGTAAIPAAAAEVVCRGTIGDVVISGDVRVPRDATCHLEGTKVRGKVEVRSGAVLVATGAAIGGSIQALNAKGVVVRRSSRIGGSVQMLQGERAIVRASTIVGDVQSGMMTGLVVIRANRVGGSVQVVANTGGAEIFDNLIAGDLQCARNDPAPTGGENRVAGAKQGQCRTF